MLDRALRRQIREWIQKEVVPALGCSEPVAVALATARSREALGIVPQSIEVFVTGNIYKNGMGVGIPGTGMAGLDIAAGLGALCGRSEDGLEVLKHVDTRALNAARKMMDDKKIKIRVKEVTDSLYVESITKAGRSICRTIISHRHTHIVLVEKNGKILFQADKAAKNKDQPHENGLDLSVEKIIEFADQSPIDELTFILEGVKLNSAISQGCCNNKKSVWDLEKSLFKVMGRASTRIYDSAGTTILEELKT